MSVSTNDFKNGMTLELDGVLFQVVEFQHVKPGKGGAFVRTKLRNVKTGAMIERTFNAGVKVGLSRREMIHHLSAAGRRDRLHVMCGKIILDHFAHRRVIVDDQDASRGALDVAHAVCG